MWKIWKFIELSNFKIPQLLNDLLLLLTIQNSKNKEKTSSSPQYNNDKSRLFKVNMDIWSY